MTERSGGEAGGGNGGRDAVPGRCQIDTRLRDDELVVVADLFLTTADDLTVGIDRNGDDLVICMEGTVVGRVELPWESSEATRARFNNGVLEVRLRRAEP